jgi:hypothetical protein
VTYWNGEEELYDLANDPYELQSRHRDTALAGVKAQLSQQALAQRGLAIIPVGNFPAARMNAAYSTKLRTWGGLAPFTWRIDSGALPPGLTLSASSGLISGVPTRTGRFTFTVRVTDSAMATQAKRPRTFLAKPFTIVVS